MLRSIDCCCCCSCAWYAGGMQVCTHAPVRFLQAARFHRHVRNATGLRSDDWPVKRCGECGSRSDGVSGSVDGSLGLDQQHAGGSAFGSRDECGGVPSSSRVVRCVPSRPLRSNEAEPHQRGVRPIKALLLKRGAGRPRHDLTWLGHWVNGLGSLFRLPARLLGSSLQATAMLAIGGLGQQHALGLGLGFGRSMLTARIMHKSTNQQAQQPHQQPKWRRLLPAGARTQRVLRRRLNDPAVAAPTLLAAAVARRRPHRHLRMGMKRKTRSGSARGSCWRGTGSD